ncbi:site-specific integrase [Paraburkholderia sp. DGU8]|uniref:site-specific integrase n=1 Tax=Paraburkholderia sp. DGU8 TaxID=3161997 RepID=UPI0034657FC6
MDKIDFNTETYKLFLLRFMLVRIDVSPGYAIVDANRLMPRFWATAWSLGLGVRFLAPNTLKLRLRHIDAFYCFTDEHFGLDSLDGAISARNAAAVGNMVEAFFTSLTVDSDYTTTNVQRWKAVRRFALDLARLRAPASEPWSSLSSMLGALRGIRNPNQGKIRHIRALPAQTLVELLNVAEPGVPRNPFRDYHTQNRNWFIVNLLLMCGLRRGEALLLGEDSLKQEYDPDSGELVFWLDVTTCFDEDPRATTPSMKTAQSHRQIPVSSSLAELYEHYLSEVRQSNGEHPYLLTSRAGGPLSAESLTKMFERLSEALPEAARNAFYERSGKSHLPLAFILRNQESDVLELKI